MVVVVISCSCFVTFDAALYAAQVLSMSISDLRLVAEVCIHCCRFTHFC